MKRVDFMRQIGRQAPV